MQLKTETVRWVVADNMYPITVGTAQTGKFAEVIKIRNVKYRAEARISTISNKSD